MKRFIAAILLTLSLNIQAADTSLKKELDNLLRGIQVEHQIPAMAVAVIASGEVIYQQGFGFLDKDKTRSVTKDTLFRVASISKLFTAQAIMQLVERDKVSLDDKLGKHLPQFKESSITIRHLLTHSSGVKDKLKPLNIDKQRALEEYLNELSELIREVEPSNSFEYSDAGFNLLGAVVSATTEMEFEDYIKQNIFHPSGMNHSGYYDGRQGIRSEALPTYKGKLLTVEQLRPYDVAFYPSEGLVSNLEDLSYWMISTLTIDDNILTENSYQQMLQPRVKTTWGDIYIGLGWQLYKEDGQLVARHPGSIRGYKALIISYPESKNAMILLSNAHQTPRWDIARIVKEKLVESETW